VSDAPNGVTALTSGAGANGVTVNVSGSTGFVGTFGISTTVSDGLKTSAADFLFTATDAGAVTLTNPGTQSNTAPTVVVTLNGSDPDVPAAPLSFGARVFSDINAATAYSIQQQLLLTMDPFASASNPFDMGTFGTNYKWVYSQAGTNAAGNHYYFLLSNGELHYWDGTNNPNVSATTLVTTLTAAYYTNPSLLLSPVTTATGNTSTTVSVTNNQITFGNLTSGQTVFAVAFVTDGLTIARQTFQVTAT
jgi:hypothetical protein